MFVIVAGIVLETFAEVKVSDVDAALREHESDKITTAEVEAASATRNAGTAQGSAIAAQGAALTAKDVSDAAAETASRADSAAAGARREAETFEKDILSAKTLAASAEAHLADALEREARAEEQLKKLHTDRSLKDMPSLVSALRAFAGTEYKLSVVNEEESKALLAEVNSMLTAAGWSRRVAKYQLGIPAFNVFSQDGKDSTPECGATGIEVTVHSTQSLAVLQSQAENNLPKTVQAAIIFDRMMSSHIEPADEKNMKAQASVELGPDEEPMIICIGKKP